MGRKRYAAPYMWLVVACGAVVGVYSVCALNPAVLDFRLLLLTFVTVLIGARIAIQIPRISGQITVADTVIFLTLLVYGGEPAILLAALEGVCSSLRISRKPLTILFNSAMMAVSMFATVHVLRYCFGGVEALLHGSYSAALIAAVCVMALVQYAVNSSLAAAAQALKTDRPVWQTWHKYYLWSSFTYLAGASAAAIVAKLTGALGLYSVVVTAPIIVVVYFTYHTYLKNIEVAERHVEELSSHIAEQERIRRALEESEEHYRSAFEHFRSAFDHAAGMALVAPDGRWLEVNHSLCEMLGYEEQEMLGLSLGDVAHPDDLAAVLINIDRLVKDKSETFQVEQRFLHKRGHTVWTLLSVSVVTAAADKSAHLIFQSQDITDRKRAEERLVHDALHDSLTGLPNRVLFMDHLKHAVERARRNKGFHFTVLFLDLDRFKIINDSLGHMVGDQLLVGIARRLETCVRSIDTVARLGGDEFTILLEDLKDPAETVEIVNRIQSELSVPFKLGGHEVFTSVSIGVAPSTTGYERAEDILRDADTAMYRAKSSGKARHEVFDREMHAHAMNLLHIETDLRRAVERGEMRLHYQPIVSLADESIIGFEALVRWQHSERGLVSPMDFIPVAEETGLIVPIGRWVLREACRQMSEWKRRDASAAQMFMSVNLSGKQFTQPDLLGQVTRILEETGLDPHSLKLEITESVVMENIDAAIETLESLRSLGVEVSIDDFGTGYSSLSYLHRLPIDTLKVDRSFVSRMASNNENTEIVRTIVTLAQSLDMKVVAEGVETSEQLSQLQILRCEGAQGYLFSRPLDAEAASALLAGISSADTVSLLPPARLSHDSCELVEGVH
ncbi:MAG: putative bifunctional diguanylate cyclase/phosphodiesterase [Pyrinomonadaceae bacterium]